MSGMIETKTLMERLEEWILQIEDWSGICGTYFQALENYYISLLEGSVA